MSKIYLSKEQIEDILSFIVPNKAIPEETANFMVEKHKNLCREPLSKIFIYPEVIPVIKKELERQYFRTLVQPGECVGVLMAQDIGERQTQTNLNTFHKAGSSDKPVDTVSKFNELISGTKNIKAPGCFVYFNHGNSSVTELRNTIKNSIVGVNLLKISKKWFVKLNKEVESWYAPYFILYNDEHRYKDCFCVEIDMDKLYEYNLTLESVAKTINDSYEDIQCIFSPDSISRLDIFVNPDRVEAPPDHKIFTPENVVEFYIEEVVIPELEKMVISGIDKIDGIYFIREEGKDEKGEEKWMIETNGSNLIKLLAHPDVDEKRTKSNNIWDIYSILGIEATRQFMIDEFISVMEGINVPHITLLVDRMTFLGTISSISRYTMRDDESGPMGKASFEETLDNFLKAGLYGQIEPAQGVSSSIICGKRSNMGTGLCTLIPDLRKLQPNLPEIKEDSDYSSTDEEEEDNEPEEDDNEDYKIRETSDIEMSSEEEDSDND